MEIPNLVRERLGGEPIEATVNLGDEDVIAVTPTRTILYRGEGLLSDESVEAYSHDVERLDLSQGRRNTKFSLSYVDGTKEFKVPGDRTETLLQILMQGILRTAGVAADDESVAGVFQFSELTLVVTEARLVKHIGTPVWDEDFEVYDYDDVTALDFEEGSVATQIVLTVDGRPQRIKAPSEQAPKVEQTLTQTLCAYYDVNSLEELAAKLNESADDDGSADAPEPAAANELQLEDGISPLVGESEDDAPTEQPAQSSEQATTTANTESHSNETAHVGQASPSPQSQSTATQSRQSDQQRSVSTPDQSQSSQSSSATVEADAVDAEDIEAIKEQLSTLTEAVKRQNKLLRKHSERLDANDQKVDQLIEELRRGR